MNTDGLKTLWREAFGDPDSFIDGFFRTGFDPDRCAVMEQQGQVLAALYWFDCSLGDRRIAYIYAVATRRSHRGRGLCRRLMEKAHQALARQGYSGCILVPAEAGLYTLYNKLGYRVCSHVDVFSCPAGEPIALELLTPEAYAAHRAAMVPPESAIQEGATLDFLSTWCSFYRGEDILLCAALEEDKLYVQELLGDRTKAPGITAALGAKEGRFRTPGTKMPFAMYFPLDGSPAPAYLGLALD